MGARNLILLFKITLAWRILAANSVFSEGKFLTRRKSFDRPKFREPVAFFASPPMRLLSVCVGEGWWDWEGGWHWAHRGPSEVVDGQHSSGSTAWRAAQWRPDKDCCWRRSQGLQCRSTVRCYTCRSSCPRAPTGGYYHLLNIVHQDMKSRSHDPKMQPSCTLCVLVHCLAETCESPTIPTDM